MRGLTLWRPWLWAILHAPSNAKRIENRPWKPWASIIGKHIALHGGKKFDSEAAEHLCSMYGLHPDGNVPLGWKDEGIVGVARVEGFFDSERGVANWRPPQTVWWSGPYAWHLTDVVALAEPIACKGAQGLWPLGDDLERQVLRAAAHSRAARAAAMRYSPSYTKEG